MLLGGLLGGLQDLLRRAKQLFMMNLVDLLGLYSGPFGLSASPQSKRGFVLNLDVFWTLSLISGVSNFNVQQEKSSQLHSGYTIQAKETQKKNSTWY